MNFSSQAEKDAAISKLKDKLAAAEAASVSDKDTSPVELIVGKDYTFVQKGPHRKVKCGGFISINTIQVGKGTRPVASFLLKENGRPVGLAEAYLGDVLGEGDVVLQQDEERQSKQQVLADISGESLPATGEDDIPQV